MIRLDHFIFGYTVIRVGKEHIGTAAGRLMRGGWTVRIDRGGAFRVLLREREGICRTLGDLPHTVSEPRGLGGALLSLRHRYGILLAALIFVLLLVISSNTVWDVRVEGCEEGSEAEVLAELDSAGLSVGASWSRIDKSEVEVRVLSDSERVAWININRRGTVAYVRVVPKTTHPSPPTKEGYANVVAARAGVIEQITVKSGIALVRVGETVRAGQVLISGVIPAERGGGFCYAEGTVIARFTDRVEVDIPLTVTEKIYTGENRRDFSLNFFGKDINILKRYGNSVDGCDIIEEKNSLSLFGKTLPISYTVCTARPFRTEMREVAADEAAALGAASLREALSKRLAKGELVSVHTEGEFLAECYRMTADIVLRESIAEEKKFEFNPE